MNAVVPDGIETDERRSAMPGGGPVLALLLAGAVGLFVVSGGQGPPPPVPDDTLPQLEVLLEGAWERVDLPGSAPLTAVALTRGGDYLAAGVGPQFWWSRDGAASWSVGSWGSETPGTVADIVTLSGEAAVAVGSETHQGLEPEAMIWTSPDGESWDGQKVSSGVPSGLDGVVFGDQRLMAWGWTGSPDDLTPEVGPLLMTSADGVDWTPVEGLEHGFRIHNVEYGPPWLVMGSLAGQAALWTSTDLTTWEVIPPDRLPFGWAMVDLRFELSGATVANLLDLGAGRSRQWRLGEDGTWAGLGSEIIEGPVTLTGEADDFLAVGSGHLWSGETQWSDVGLDGEVLDLAGNVAVGGVDGQPAMWVRGVEIAPVVEVPRAPGPTWEITTDLGEGELGGPWPVADRWIVGVGNDWSLVRANRIRTVSDLADTAVWRIDQVGEEWVALPSMRWSSDGLKWERRSDPWLDAGRGVGFVAAVAQIDGSAVAVGFDEDRMWAVANSTDGGRTWTSVPVSAPPDSLRDIRAVAGGFIAVSRPASGEEPILYHSPNGTTWSPIEGAQAVAGAEPAAFLSPEGRLVMAGTAEVFGFTHGEITAVARQPEGMLAVATSDSLWLGPAPWVEIPLDPTHGWSAADVRPIPVDGELLAVAVDRGRIRILQWSG
ncbi:MAG: hypothetical protein ACRDVD_02325 [Acidimicrobiia bacterium]